MAADAVAYASSEHDLPAAAIRIEAVLNRAIADHASSHATTASLTAR
jgi:hypothetical protein